MLNTSSVRFALALTVLLSILTAAHVYLWFRYIRGPGWSRGLQRGLTLGLVVLGTSIPFGFAVARGLPRSSGSLLAYVAFGWLGVLFFFGVLSGLAEIIRGGRWLKKRTNGSPEDPERRQVFERGLTLAVGASTGLGSSWALASGMREAGLKEVEVGLERLPKHLDGMSLVQISDVHIGPTLGCDFMREVAETIRGAKPEMLFVTGDLVDGSVEQLREHVAPLGQLRPRHGAYFITGNHEYYSGAEAWCQELSRLGVRVLRNEWVRPLPGLQLVGVDDYDHQQGAGSRIAPELDRDEETILLAHRPQSIPEAEALGAGLQISGHTHGGQIYPMAEIVRLTTPYVAGLYQHDTRTQIYVSRGTGYWGPPMRLAAPAEVTRIVLRSKA